VVSTGDGNYQVTVPAANVIDNSNLLTVVKARSGSAAETSYIGTWELEGTANIQLGTAHLRDLVTNTGCASCHGPYPAWSEKFQHYAVGGSECQICHSIVGRNIGIISLLDNGSRVESQQKAGTNLPEYIHGIHKSETMPDGSYFRSLTGSGPEQVYSIGYPSDMRNCKVCHTTTAQLATAAAAPVSYHLCMSCHQKWDGFVDHNGVQLFAAGNFHRGFGMATPCMDCHGLVPTMNEAADFHDSNNGFPLDLAKPDVHYNQFYRGTDISYDNPDNVLFKVTGVTKSGDNVTFTWTASKGGVAVDPCNTDLNAGPIFNYPDSNGVAGKGGLAAYLAYAKGDDWVNENVITATSSNPINSPGQPKSARNLFTSLTTTCASNVATTTGLQVSANTDYAAKASLAIGGKPIAKHDPTGTGYVVRVPSPTYAFSMADGAAAAARRNVVNTTKCLSCHRGTMYQHGGDRIDNAQMCVICHNPSSADKNNRLTKYQIVNDDGTVNRDATYDGKSNETYDLRTLLHAIHGAEKRANPYVIYRSRGIYAFATGDALKPTGWPAAGDNTIYGSTNGSKIAHNWTVVDYPQPANNCLACHDAPPDAPTITYEAPNQTKAAAVTVEPGTDWVSQADDISIGPTAAACTACHATSAARSHAQHEGYMANVIKEDMLEMSEPDAFWVVPPSP
jgi:OmcA/MtrC family decaheme c-type cytochrome